MEAVYIEFPTTLQISMTVYTTLNFGTRIIFIRARATYLQR